MLERVTGRLKGEHADGDTPSRNRKRRRTGEVTGPVEQFVGMTETTQYGEGQEWQSTSQGQEFAMGGVAGNVDPGLQMPQGS